MVLLYAHINKKSNTFSIKIPGKALQAALEAIELRLTRYGAVILLWEYPPRGTRSVL